MGERCSGVGSHKAIATPEVEEAGWGLVRIARRVRPVLVDRATRIDQVLDLEGEQS